jgi:hypothetical protein
MDEADHQRRHRSGPRRYVGATDNIGATDHNIGANDIDHYAYSDDDYAVTVRPKA